MVVGSALVVTKAYAAPEVGAVWSRVRELASETGDTRQLFRALWGLWAFGFQRGQLREAIQASDDLLPLAKRMKDPDSVIGAHLAKGLSWYAGELVEGLHHLNQAIAIYGPARDSPLAGAYGVDMRAAALAHKGCILALLGYPDQALGASRESLTTARALSHPFSLAYTLRWASMTQQLRREPALTEIHTEETIAGAEEREFAAPIAWGTFMQGWTWAEQGRPAEGIAEIRRGREMWEATGARVMRTYLLGLLAHACRRAGRTKEAVEAVLEALAIAESSGEAFYGAELHRLHGELVLEQPGNQTEAEASFRRALEAARGQKAKLLELRAAVSLSRLWQARGEPEEARSLLTGIYEWFTEGFDTADLREAEHLMETLDE